MNNKEDIPTDVVQYMNENCFLSADQLIKEFMSRKSSAGLTDRDVETCCQWTYLDLRKEGKNSWYHKDKQRVLPNEAYICEMISNVLFAKSIDLL